MQNTSEFKYWETFLTRLRIMMDGASGSVTNWDNCMNPPHSRHRKATTPKTERHLRQMSETWIPTKIMKGQMIGSKQMGRLTTHYNKCSIRYCKSSGSEKLAISFKKLGVLEVIVKAGPDLVQVIEKLCLSQYAVY